ncbi:hypothetical protein AGLY_014499 [Aphis glycines]|uniref:Uncharacterized protein n=1 Tax=Aphis glycines TaxID=307491 RepID=A0A6G0T419_APHGL|nr:hypothetical protein AGLY_014499 [Aphis glycines]
MICQPRIYFPLGGEKGCLCFNDLNTPKLNTVNNHLVILRVNFGFRKNLNKDKNILIGQRLRLTHDELCIKFLSILLGQKNFIDIYKKKLNKNECLKCLWRNFQDKSLSLRDFVKILIIRLRVYSIEKKAGKWVPFCCTLEGEVDLGLGITYEELCIKFSSILIGPKKFYRHFKKNFSEKLKISVIFEEKFMENLVPNFQNLVKKEKNFMIFQLQNYLTYFFVWSFNTFLSTLQKKILRKIENFCDL